MSEARYTVTHSDGETMEIVRDLDLHTARRLVERDESAGRWAYMIADDADPFAGLDTPYDGNGRGNRRYRWRTNPLPERPALGRGDLVIVREENIRPWSGSVLSVKPSSVSGWWIEVRRDDDRIVMAVPASKVELLPPTTFTLGSGPPTRPSKRRVTP